MKDIDRQKVRAAMERSDCSWLFHMTEDTDAVLDAIANELKAFLLGYKNYFPTKPEPDPFRLLDQNLDRGATFFQMFAAPPLSIEFRINAWRILMGADVEVLDVAFDQTQARQPFKIVLVTRFHGESKPFRSAGHSIWDFQVVQRLGIGEVSGRPFFGGFYRSDSTHEPPAALA